MRRLALLLLPALLAIGAAPAAKVEITARHGKSLRGTVDGFPFLLLRGTSRERGVAHGTLAAKQVVALLDTGLVGFLERQRPGMWDREFMPQLGKFAWPKRFEEELDGLLEGLRTALPAAADRTLTSLKREIGVADLKVLNVLSDLLGTGCSSFAAWGDRTPDGAVVVGRNLDYTAFPVTDHFHLIATEPAEKDLLPTLEILAPGFVGAGTTLNGEGVFMSLHDEPGLPGSTKPGWAPRSLRLRQAVETARASSGVKDMAASLRGAPVRVGNNVLVAAPQPPAAVLEWDGGAKESGVTVRDARNSASIACTNHYLSRADRGTGGDSQERHARLSEALGADRKIDFVAAKAMLASVAKDGGLVTHLSVVCWPASKRYAWSTSPSPGVSATKGTWRTIEWADIFKP